MYETVSNEKLRLLKLMLYREVGAIGFNVAINKLADKHPQFHQDIQHEIDGIKKDLEEQY